MRFLKKNFWTLSCLAFVMVMAVSGNALADGNTLMETAQTKAMSVISSVKTIIFIVGGFGLVGLAIQAINGKGQWPCSIVEIASGSRDAGLETNNKKIKSDRLM